MTTLHIIGLTIFTLDLLVLCLGGLLWVCQGGVDATDPDNHNVDAKED